MSVDGALTVIRKEYRDFIRRQARDFEARWWEGEFGGEEGVEALESFLENEDWTSGDWAKLVLIVSDNADAYESDFGSVSSETADTAAFWAIRQDVLNELDSDLDIDSDPPTEAMSDDECEDCGERLTRSRARDIDRYAYIGQYCDHCQPSCYDCGEELTTSAEEVDGRDYCFGCAEAVREELAKEVEEGE